MDFKIYSENKKTNKAVAILLSIVIAAQSVGVLAYLGYDLGQYVYNGISAVQVIVGLSAIWIAAGLYRNEIGV